MSSRRTPALPAGPPMSRLGGTVAFHRDPIGFLRSAQRDHGDLFTIRLATVGPVVVIAEQQAAESLAALDSGADGAAAHAGRARRALLPMVSERSAFGGDEEQHRSARARAWPAFSPEAVADRRERIDALARRHISMWPLSRPIRLLPRMRRLADEVFVREILGVAEPGRVAALCRSIGRLMWAPGNPPTAIPSPADGMAGRAVDLLYRRRRAPIARLIRRELVARRETSSGGRDLLDLLLEAKPERGNDEIVEELISMLMAAQEPMASALSWLALSLAAEAQIQERLAEAPAGGGYERAVIEESLRLHPPALGMLRRLERDATIAGRQLPAGTTALAAIPLLQRDPRVFEQPDRFLPERHLEGDAERPLAPVWPFGHGARRCIAEALALAQLTSVVRTLLMETTIAPLGPQPERAVLRATILVPQRSALAMLSARAATMRRPQAPPPSERRR